MLQNDINNRHKARKTAGTTTFDSALSLDEIDDMIRDFFTSVYSKISEIPKSIITLPETMLLEAQSAILGMKMA